MMKSLRGSQVVRHDEKLPLLQAPSGLGQTDRTTSLLRPARISTEGREKLGEPGSNGPGPRLAGHNSDICRKKTNRQWADLSRTLELFDPTQGSWGVSLP